MLSTNKAVIVTTMIKTIIKINLHKALPSDQTLEKTKHHEATTLCLSYENGNFMLVSNQNNIQLQSGDIIKTKEATFEIDILNKKISNSPIDELQTEWENHNYLQSLPSKSSEIDPLAFLTDQNA